MILEKITKNYKGELLMKRTFTKYPSGYVKASTNRGIDYTKMTLGKWM